MTPTSLPLCVDLDDTLVLGDTVLHSLKHIVRDMPGLTPTLLWKFLTGGRPKVKAWMASIAPINAAALPYRTDLVDYLRAERDKGRAIYLVSAASQNTVDRVAAHLKIFSAAYGSSATYNLKGANKADFIIKTIGAKFVYAGDSFADVAVWNKAEAAILCGKKAAAIRPLLNRAVEQVFDQDRPRPERAVPWE
jgi:phosphoserine phosphatase